MEIQAIERVLILGAGWVGRQVAARLAQHGVQVWLVDRQPSVCEEALQWMRSLPAADSSSENRDDDPHAAADANTWVQRVHCQHALSDFAAGCVPDGSAAIDLVIESVPEQISLKKRVLRQASQQFGAEVIIASNSSYFVPSVLSRFVEHPDRFAHLHFHVPVLVDSVVDIVGCEQTKPVVIALLEQLTRRIGHEPLLLRREHPGYIFNWLLQSVLRSALELAALDVADPRDIDKSWTAVTGMPLGPFGMMDQIGLDVIEQVLSNGRWADAPHITAEQLMGMIREHTSRGELGVKTQRGFYDYR